MIFFSFSVGANGVRLKLESGTRRHELKYNKINYLEIKVKILK